MQTRFLHFADCHLGYRQYNLMERADDFARAFLETINAAIKEQVNFVILAGDLFQKRAIDALTLNQAMVGLERLANAGIPCLAVEGNHEHAYFQDHIGWMEFLAQRRLLTLLDAPFEQGKPRLSSYDARRRQGSYAEPVAGVRVHGLRYRGSGTAAAIQAYAQALDELPRADYTIFVAHAGLDGVVPGASGGLTYRQWSVLKPHVDYLALGHVHKPFTREEWIFNPGSLETCSMAEVEWDERGYYLVQVDTDRRTGGAETEPMAPHTATLRRSPRRPFARYSVRVDHFPGPDALLSYLDQFLKRKAADQRVTDGDGVRKAVIELQLTGVLPFDRGALDMERIEGLVVQHFQPLVALVKNLTRAMDFGITTDAGASRADLERQILLGLLEQDTRFQKQGERWADLLVRLKHLALDGASASAMLEEVDAAMAAVVEQDGVSPLPPNDAPPPQAEAETGAHDDPDADQSQS